jgi:phage virion morphogenesis protein
MATISVEVDDAQIKQLLKELFDRASDLTPALKNIGEYMRFSTAGNFKLEKSPDGQPWKKLSPKYAQKKAKAKAIQKKLQFTGDLRASIAYSVSPRSVEIGTNKKVGSYSLGAIHQFGAPRRNIPARPFLGLGADDRKQVLAIIRSFLIP